MKKNLKRLSILLIIIILTIIFKEKYSILLEKITEIQRHLIPLISKKFKSKDSNFSPFLFLFLFGIVHSIGPGHGKFILLSSTLIDKLNKQKIFILSAIISYLKGFSALLFYYIFLFLKEKISPYLSFSLENRIQKIISILIIFLLIFIIFREIKKNHSPLNKINTKNVYILSFLVGLIPCSGILNILIFLKLLNLEKYNFISTISICSGMFLTLFLSGIFANYSINILKNITNIYYIKYIGFIFIFIYIFINFIVF